VTALPPHRLVLLDTQIIVFLMRGKQAGQKIDATLGLSARPERPLLCSVVEGEMLGLARSWSWGPARINALRSSLDQMVRVSSAAPEVVEAYSELYAALGIRGRKMGENDLWISATARAVGAILVLLSQKVSH
jgi:tRNA(fMet)-specific endonuclease VapC